MAQVTNCAKYVTQIGQNGTHLARVYKKLRVIIPYKKIINAIYLDYHKGLQYSFFYSAILA